MSSLAPGSHNLLSINVKDGDGSAVTTATVTATVYDLGGQALTGATNITLAHVSSGDYEGTIPNTVSIIEGRRYRVIYSVNASGVVGTTRLEVDAGY